MEGDTIPNDTFSEGYTRPNTPVGGPIEQGEWAAKRVVLAGIGACATVLDSAEQTFDEFVERGRRVQDEWQDRTDEMRQRNMSNRMRARESFRSAMNAFLDTLNVPSKADVDTINVKLNILTRKLDSLQMQEVERETAPPPPSVPPVPPFRPEPGESDLAT